MKVTVYLVTFNRKVLLERAILSVINQTYKNIELIVIDDNSQDGTKEYLESNYDEYNKLLDFKFYVNSENRGACFSRNRAIQAATCEFITGLDDDDEFISIHIDNLIKNYNARYSFVSSSSLENNGINTFIRNNNVGTIDLNLLLHFNAIGNQVLTKTQYLKNIGGFNERLPALQDYDTWVRLAARYGEGVKLKEASYICHTGHGNNRISNSNHKRLLALDLFIKSHKQKMTPSHFKSYFFLKKKIEWSELSLIELILNINKFNWRPAIALYINLNFPSLGRKWRAMKDTRI